MNAALILTLAMILDALLGEPRWLWARITHPAVLMGRAVGWADARLNRGDARYLKGMAALTGLVLMAATAGWLLSLLGPVVEILVLAALLAHRSLVDHVRDVASALRVSLGDGRRAVARIVGRDTARMDRPAVARAAIESAAENLSDGVIAPAFWFLIAGLPGLLIYKITNTADSMIGYRNARYGEFGWAAARFDDLLNLVPARLTALLIALTHQMTRALSDIRSDASHHRSPNAGWPEAAMARALNVSLAGPRSYDGYMRDFPFVHPHGQTAIGPDQIDAACAVLWRSWGALLAAALFLSVLLCILPG